MISLKGAAVLRQAGTAARNGSNVIDAPAVVVPEVQPVLDKTQGRSGEAVDQAGSEGKQEPAGDGRTGRGWNLRLLTANWMFARG